VKIARKGLRGTMAKMQKRVLALSQEANQVMRSHIMLRIKSLVKVTLSHEVNSYI
jgi:hypothetical protein